MGLGYQEVMHSYNKDKTVLGGVLSDVDSVASAILPPHPSPFLEVNSLCSLLFGFILHGSSELCSNFHVG